MVSTVCFCLFVFLSCVEMVECEQPSVLATHPTEGTWLHSCRPHLRSRGESFPGHHRNLQGAELSEAAGGVEQSEQESS